MKALHLYRSQKYTGPRSLRAFMGGLNVTPYDPAGWPGQDDFPGARFGRFNGIGGMGLQFSDMMIELANARFLQPLKHETATFEIAGMPLVSMFQYRGRDSFDPAMLSFYLGREDRAWGALIGFTNINERVNGHEYDDCLSLYGAESINRADFERDMTLIKMFPDEWFNV